MGADHLVRQLRAHDRLRLGHPVGTALASYDRAPHRPLLPDRMRQDSAANASIRHQIAAALAA